MLVKAEWKDVEEKKNIRDITDEKGQQRVEMRERAVLCLYQLQVASLLPCLLLSLPFVLLSADV